MHTARGRLPYDNTFGFAYAVALFVWEAYMPPGRGEWSRGVYGKSTVFPTL